MVQDFKQLRVWQSAHALTLAVYDMTTSFPSTERYALTSQFRRAAGSVAANIAEGCGRRTSKEFRQFLYHAYGSAKECENHLILTKDLGYINEKIYEKMCIELDSLSRSIYTLIKRVNIEHPT